MERSQLILLVEDEAFIALMLQDLLESAGYLVVIANNFQDAVTVIEKRSTEISALVTDIRLGSSTDGWALARKARERLPDVPIAYMSGGDNEHRAMGVTKSTLLAKPFTAAQFLAAVAAMFNMPSQTMVI